MNQRAEEKACSGSLNGRRSSSQQTEEVGRGTEARTCRLAHWMAGECQGDRGKRCFGLVMKVLSSMLGMTDFSQEALMAKAGFWPKQEVYFSDFSFRKVTLAVA